MEYMGNEEYWNAKFLNRSDNPLGPEKFLVESIGHFKKGTVLDIACGDGRNTLFLLEKDFCVTGIDFSSKALERLNLFAKGKGYFVNTMQIDLSIANSLDDIGVFDNIIINHYRLNKKQLANIERHLTSDGIIFISGFGHKHKVTSKIKKEDLIQPNDFEDMSKSFELVKYYEIQDDRGFFVTYIFRIRKS